MIAQHKSLSIVGKRIYCHPCNYFINARQKSHVEQINAVIYIKINKYIRGLSKRGAMGAGPLINLGPPGWPGPVTI